jgi:hypothetical protein
MNREQFAERVVAYVGRRFPLVRIIAAEDAFCVSVNGHSASLENLYRIALLKPADMKHQVDRWIVELLRAAEGTPDADRSFAELRERILPVILPESVAQTRGGAEDESAAASESGDASASQKAAPEPDDGIGFAGTVIDPFVAGLVIGYAIDNDRTISYVSRERFRRWGVSMEQLHETAIENLVARSQSMPAHAAQEQEDGPIYLILFQSMDGYDASRLLLPGLHERLREYLGSPFAAAVPSRDALMCFRDDPATLQRLRPQIEDCYKQMPNQVSDQLYLVTADGIAARR